jgi:hypothetical protein
VDAEQLPDGVMPKPDAAPMADAAVTPDSPPGMGDYMVTTATATYASPPNAIVVPGFVLKADDESYPLVLPFPFVFYGVSYAAININVNGFISFDAPVTGADGSINDCPMDTTPPGAIAAAFWDDLYATDVAPTATLTSAVTGVTPNRQLVIEWKDFDAYYLAGGGNNSFLQGIRVTHSIVLREDNVIEFHYGPRTGPTGSNTNKDCGVDRHRGCSATVGLEAPGSTLFKSLQCGTGLGPGPGYAPIDNGKLIRLTPI